MKRCCLNGIVKISTLLVVLGIIPSLFPSNAYAAMNEWVQTDWSGGVGSSVYYQYSSATGIYDTESGEVSLAKDNQLTNGEFTDGNSDWSVSAVPPEGWIEVPSNVLYADPLKYDPAHPSKSNFLVMKYEAKAWDTEAIPPAVVATGGTANGWAGANGQTRYVAVSIPEGNPWRYIAQNHSTEYDAIEACSALGTDYHLITNKEWMTIARNVEVQPANWADGVVGSLVSANGGLFRGNVGNLDSVGYDGADPEGGTGRNTKAELVLSNGQTIWDLSGNVWEWTSDTIMGADKPHNNTGAWVEWTVFVPPGASTYGTLSYDLTRPLGSSYSSTRGVGQYYQGANTGGPYGFLRGGTSYHTSVAGAFAMLLYNAPDNRGDVIGFRCASDTVAIYQSFSSSSGRGSTGGNQISVGTVADGRVFQSVNVGSADSYNFSAYLYNAGSDPVGGVVDATVAELYYGGNTITGVDYTHVGGGWYRISGSVTGVVGDVETGVLVKTDNSVVVDDLLLWKDYVPTGVVTSNIYDTGGASDWGVGSFVSSGEGTVELRVRTSNSPTMAGAPEFSTCSAITSGTDMSSNNCVSDRDRYVQYQLTLMSGSTPNVEEVRIGYTLSGLVRTGEAALLLTGIGALLFTASRILMFKADRRLAKN